MASQELAVKAKADPNRKLLFMISETPLDSITPTSDRSAPERRSLSNVIRGVLRELPDRESRVLGLRYGFGGKRARTIDETCEELSLKRQQVRSIESQATRRLRQEKFLCKFRRFLPEN